MPKVEVSESVTMQRTLSESSQGLPERNYAGQVEVTLTIQNNAGEIGHISAVGPDYEVALANAQALIPEDCKAIVIRKGQ
jgi:hypothetical protein